MDGKTELSEPDRFYFSASGTVPFLEFEDQLQRLWELYVLQEAAIAERLREIATEHREYERWSQENPEDEAAAYVAESQDFHEAGALSASEDYPRFVRASALAVLFALLESLLRGLALEASEQCDADFEPYRDAQRKLPELDRNLLFLTEACGMESPLTRRHRRELDSLRSLRNKLIHELGSDLPEHIARELDKIFPADHGRFELNPEFLRGAFEVVGEIASKIEVAYDRRFYS
jgi:hypothetical protein